MNISGWGNQHFEDDEEAFKECVNLRKKKKEGVHMTYCVWWRK